LFLRFFNSGKKQNSFIPAGVIGYAPMAFYFLMSVTDYAIVFGNMGVFPFIFNCYGGEV
jgi:hypothetical protein